MWGAIVGDIAGSHYEHFPDKSLDIEFFREHTCATDDSILTIAVADWILNGGSLYEYFHDYVDRYPNAGYGGTFVNWARCRETVPYNSWGNGAAMRVSPTAYAKNSLDEVLELAKDSAIVTHDHPEGVKGAQATAGCVFLARNGATKEQVKNFAIEIGYNLSRTIDEIRPRYGFDVSCAGSVPESISAFLESTSYEHAITLAISLGGDSDTMACIAGAIAEPFYGGVPNNLLEQSKGYLDESLLNVVESFSQQYLSGSNCQK